MNSSAKRGSREVKEYLSSLDLRQPPEPLPELARLDPDFPEIYTPAAVYKIGGEVQALFITGEYDYDDARLVAIVSRYKSLVSPSAKTLFLTVPKTGAAVEWLGRPTRAAALAARLNHAAQESPNDTAALVKALRRSVSDFFGVKQSRMGEDLAALDRVLDEHFLPEWTLASEGRDLVRPLTLALNKILRSALDELLPAEKIEPGSEMLRERLRLWKKGPTWYRFQSLEYVEDIFRNRKASLKAGFDALYNVNQNPESQVDWVGLRLSAAPEVPEDPDRVPFAGGGRGGSGIKGEFLTARQALLAQQGVNANDLVWAVAECGKCGSRSRYRIESDPLGLVHVGVATARIKSLLSGPSGRSTYKCSRCGQPLGFQHLVLAAYGHFLADQDRDLHFLNEKRPGRRRTFVQTICDGDLKCKMTEITDESVTAAVGRPLSARGMWRSLLKASAQKGNQKRELNEGFIGLAMPPGDYMRQQSAVARFQDKLLHQDSSYVAVALEPPPGGAEAQADRFPSWLGDLSPMVAEKGYSLHAFTQMDRIEELFQRAAARQGLTIVRATNGSLEIRGSYLNLPVDLGGPVKAAVLRGLFPGYLAAREAGNQARRLVDSEKTIDAIRDYLGKNYTVEYVPTTGEVQIDKGAIPQGFPLDKLVRSWMTDPQKTRREIIARVGD